MVTLVFPNADSRAAIHDVDSVVLCAREPYNRLR
jgi:hypothetical protein